MYDRFLPLESTGDKDGCGGHGGLRPSPGDSVGGSMHRRRTKRLGRDETPFVMRNMEFGLGAKASSPRPKGFGQRPKAMVSDRRRLLARAIGFGW
jgi:hypothetical protein